MIRPRAVVREWFAGKAQDKHGGGGVAGTHDGPAAGESAGRGRRATTAVGLGRDAAGRRRDECRQTAARRELRGEAQLTVMRGGHANAERTPRWLYWMLQGACAYVLLFEATDIVVVLRHREQLDQLVGGYAARLFMRPFIGTALILGGWIRFFRPERAGARVWALAAAVALAMSALVMALNSSVNDLHYSRWLMLGYPLVALVFLVYVVRGREQAR